MQILHTADEMMRWADARRAARQRIGLVPTMGFLHRGHASLMDQVRPRCDALVVSIYVNPMQFGPNEDLARYPRDLPGDLALCEAHDVDAVFAPDDLYGPDFSTRVRVSGLTERLCGLSRPVHFEGVTTVVARLFGLTRADVSMFGEKDYQQLAVIRRMARDLAIPVEVLGGLTVRDDDGLALSSRNKYLSADDRRRALSIPRALAAVARSSERDVATLLAQGVAALDVDRLDYLELVDASSLEPLQTVDRPARLIVAAFVGGTRLIDNVAVERA